MQPRGCGLICKAVQAQVLPLHTHIPGKGRMEAEGQGAGPGFIGLLIGEPKLLSLS